MEILNLHGAVLATVPGAELRWANLREEDLREADLAGADLREANLAGANLDGACLAGADLRGSDLRGAYLYEADLAGADLREANLAGADLTEAVGYDFPARRLEAVRLLRELGWTQGRAYDPDTGAMCAGAACRMAGAVPPPNIADFNDREGRTLEEVVEYLLTY